TSSVRRRRTQAAFFDCWREMTSTQRFPPPWRIMELPDRFAVQDANGQAMAFFHFQNSPNVAASAIALFKKQALQRAVRFAGPLLEKNQAGHMTARQFNEPVEPVTLENMRHNGVRSLLVWCRNCHHRRS